MLVLFKQTITTKLQKGKYQRGDEWYRLDYDDLMRVINDDYASIPINYFCAFGFLIPAHQGFPEYLSPERHPLSGAYKEKYPIWMPSPRPARPPPAPHPETDQLDMDARKRRIRACVARGIDNARHKEIEVEMYKRIRRYDRLKKTNPGDPCKNKH